MKLLKIKEIQTDVRIKPPISSPAPDRLQGVAHSVLGQ